MASFSAYSLPLDTIIIYPTSLFAGIAGILSFAIGLYKLSRNPSRDGADEDPSLVKSFLLFCYSCFLKPHSGAAKGGQQGALESFYASQADVVSPLSVQTHVPPPPILPPVHGRAG